MIYEVLLMSNKNGEEEWVETTEEVVETEEGLSLKNSTPAVVVDLESTETSLQKLLSTVGQEESIEGQDGFCCEECLPLFQDQSNPDDINGPSFILDFPTTMGVPQRALLTLPFGLMIGRSSIPNAGVGVINQGPALSPGMHFGPYEGEVTVKENAMSSDFSWEIYKGEDQYEYIDATSDSYSNWMRYVNFARSKDEANLLAVQYKGSILFHCCRAVQTGDELTVWPSSKLRAHLSKDWSDMLSLKMSRTESGESASSPIFLCSSCLLSFTTESFLLRHIEHFHLQPKADEAAGEENPGSRDEPPASLVMLVDPVKSKTCDDCGKVFKQVPHLRRHKLCVHSNKRPYCCSHCRRSFSQASGLVRHQSVHFGKAAATDKLVSTAESSALGSELSCRAEAAASEETERSNPTKVAQVDVYVEMQQLDCSVCGKSFTNEAHLKKHEAAVHEKLRPYVCSVCLKCFGQYNDLARHLQSHHKNEHKEKMDEDSEDAAIMPFSCGECLVAFSSVDDLQLHINERHSEDSAAENQGSSSAPPVETKDLTPNSAPLRPQRLKARSKVSAVTQLVAPKRKAANQQEASAVRNAKIKKHKWFSCNLCKQTYGNPDDLKAHKCTSKPLNCGQCSAAFWKSSLLRRHTQMAHGRAKSFRCNSCDKAFSTSAKLRQHQKNKSCQKYHCASELFPCSFCHFSFTMKSYLIKHIKRHHPRDYSEGLMDLEEAEGEFTCSDCGTNCADAQALASHTCIRQLKVLYLCTDCGKSFTNHYGLKQHQRIHTGEKPYSCTYCSKSFSYVGQLNVHLRTHTGEKPYLCTHCGESFRQSGDLKRHERKHTGVRPHECTECSKSFSRLQSLKAHLLLHQGQRLFKCSQCGKSFSRNYHLRRHHQKVHT
ncbi:histone-lysine N-methyltransferase PRDM9-like isoform X2 [Poecilia latipinna]|uniref:histone-lysine N-methyltransferase PRDM9-like isoform X2 n=1 Tax=Poecilia latipinna TaxID=48699 RepID=UPI00072E9479|nr:PREDICTED: histone-lysine N-methyltransferase PRDM9-like isoform X2 [Poecilia latipinna]